MDDVLQLEDQELNAMLEMMEAAEAQSESRYQQSKMTSLPNEDTPYGSDDEEYDGLFMDVIKEEGRRRQQVQLDGDEEMMDMS